LILALDLRAWMPICGIADPGCFSPAAAAVDIAFAVDGERGNFFLGAL